MSKSNKFSSEVRERADVNAQGPLAVFPPGQVARIVEVLKDIQSKAVAA